jgi:hypothetical protein
VTTTATITTITATTITNIASTTTTLTATTITTITTTTILSGHGGPFFARKVLRGTWSLLRQVPGEHPRQRQLQDPRL